MLRKVLLVLVVVFVLVSILQSPNTSAGFVRDGVGLLALGVQRILEFFGSLLSA